MPKDGESAMLMDQEANAVANTMPVEELDIVIIGAGISGIGAASYIRR